MRNIDSTIQTKSREKFVTMTGREPKPNEEVNMETDANLQIEALKDVVEDLSKRIEKIEKFLVL